MIAIQTKYLPATNTRGSRIKAFTSNGQSLTLPFDYSADSEYRRYEAVAIALCKKMNWDIELIGGGVKDGYIFNFVEPATLKNIINSSAYCKTCKEQNIEYAIMGGWYSYYCHKCHKWLNPNNEVLQNLK